MTLTLTGTKVRCGNRAAHGSDRVYHDSVYDVRSCYSYSEFCCEWDDGAAAAEQAYERYLEDRGYDEARAQDEYEARNGVVGFTEAWHRESPDTCPCDNHPQLSDPASGWWRLPIAAAMWAADGRALNA